MTTRSWPTAPRYKKAGLRGGAVAVKARPEGDRVPGVVLTATEPPLSTIEAQRGRHAGTSYLSISFRTLHVFEFRDRLIRRENTWFDSAAIIAQLS
jgi:hypothetical protein